jgi:hypothetical protein
MRYLDTTSNCLFVVINTSRRDDTVIEASVVPASMLQGQAAKKHTCMKPELSQPLEGWCAVSGGCKEYLRPDDLELLEIID